MKTILLPTDFSNTAKHAADFALTLAQTIEAKLIFLNVIQYVPDTSNINTPMPSAQIYEAAEENAEIAMERFKESALARYSEIEINIPEIETKVVYGSVSRTVLDVAEDLNVDMIVMGTFGEKDLLDKVFGSNSLHVAKNAKCPVWVIPQEIKLHSVKNIVYATDLEGDEVSIIQKSIDIAEMLGANIHALHIQEENEPEVFPSKEIIEALKEKMGTNSVVFSNLHRNDIVEGIEKYMKNQHIDALIVAHQHKGWLDRLFYKSIITQLTNHAQIPVLVLQK